MIRLFAARLTQFESRVSSRELEHYIFDSLLLNIELDTIINLSFGGFNLSLQSWRSSQRLSDRKPSDLVRICSAGKSRLKQASEVLLVLGKTLIARLARSNHGKVLWKGC